MTDREAMKMALDAMLSEYSTGGENKYSPWDVIEALRQALAQPEQEPFGYVIGMGGDKYSFSTKPPEGGVFGTLTRVYTAPPKQWVEQNHEPSWQAGFAEGKQAAMNQFIRDECDKRSRPYQEPVAYVTGTYGGHFAVKPTNPAMALPAGKALYSAPPKRQWVGLTKLDIHVLKMNYDKVKVLHTDRAEDLTVLGQDVDVNGLINAIEAKLKEKNDAP